MNEEHVSSQEISLFETALLGSNKIKETIKSRSIIQKYRDKIWTIQDFSTRENRSTIFEISAAFSTEFQNFCNLICGQTHLNVVRLIFLDTSVIRPEAYIQYVCIDLDTFFDHEQKDIYFSQVHT